MHLIRIFIVLILLMPSSAFAQKYHQPAEILKIVANSKISYQITQLDIPEMEIVKYPVQLEYGYFLKKLSKGGIRLTTFNDEYRGNPEYEENFKVAASAIAEHKLSQAREAYLKILSVAPAQSQVMTFIGQTYEFERNDSAASAWYHRAIGVNYFDYMAHWFLAEIYESAGEREKALKEILTATIMNRNNPGVREALARILQRSGLHDDDWEFGPRYEVKDLGSNTVSVQYDRRHPEWLAYALCKAVWEFEPGYRESMVRDTREHPSMIEEKECLVNLLIWLKDSDTGTKDTALLIAQKALDEKMVSEYLLYESILPRDPGFVFNLSEAFVESISNYIMIFRWTKS